METFGDASLSTADSLPADSAAQQGAVTPGASADQTTLNGQAAEADPYADVSNLPWGQDPRFQQFLNDRKELQTIREKATVASQFEPFAPLIQQLRENNINSFEEFQASIEQQRTEQQTQAQIEQHLSQTAKGLMDKVNNGYTDPLTGETVKLDIATAERLFDLEKAQIHGQRTQQTQSEQLMNLQLDTLRAKPEYANMDADYVQAMVKATGRPLEQVAKESHQRETLREQQVLAKYNGTKQVDRQQTEQTPQGGGASTPAAATDMPSWNDSPEEFNRKWKLAERAGRLQ